LAALKRTPCVGICSTTYGDLVCRGCKRFAHEIIAWNGFDDDQRGRVWQRLHELLDGAVAVHLRILDESRLFELAEELRIAERAELSQATLAFEVLRRCARRGQSLESMGLSANAAQSASELLEAVEQEFFQRSIARYEHDFRTLAQ
jgi:predicted Fe-S protein YdhL (DUF1289 family)